MEKVLVVGGGPIGLALGVGLVQKGVPVQIIDKSPGISTFPKASTIHPPTMEILEEWGLIDEALKIGKVVNKIQFWRRKTKKLITEFDLSVLGEFTKYPFRLHFDQQFLSQIFLAYLKSNELATVRYNTELLDLTQDDKKVTVELKTVEGKVVQEEYAYLVGADGISSTVREKLGITFTGHTNPHYHLLMGLKNFEFETPFESIPGVAALLDEEEWVDIISNRDMLKVIIPVTHNRSEEVTDEFIREKIKDIGVVKEGFDIFYKTIYKTHQLVASKVFDNRVMLIGDASHVNIEFGGMGMNSGIHDAYLLVDRFVRVLKGEDPQENLAAFAEKRKRITEEVVQRDTVRLTQFFENPDLHEAELLKISADPERTKQHLLRSSMIEGYRMMFEDNLQR